MSFENRLNLLIKTRRQTFRLTKFFVIFFLAQFLFENIFRRTCPKSGIPLVVRKVIVIG